MLTYIVRRLFIAVTLAVVSAIIFVIIQLPPGDYLTTYIAELQSQGEAADSGKIEFLRKQYGLDQPLWKQYVFWVLGMFQGDFGYSFEYDLPVSDVVGDRLWLSLLLNFSTVIFIWVVAFPIGFYSATHQYSWGDHGLTFLGFLGLATPNFLLALVLMYFLRIEFGISIGGMMDPQYVEQPMSWAKTVSIAEHLIVPVVVIGTAGTAGMIRRLRANLLDELQKQYVVTGRAKGLPNLRLLLKYPVRMSLNPFVADIGNMLPQIVSGSADRGHGDEPADHGADADRRAAQPGHVSRRLVPDVPLRAHHRRHAAVRPGARPARPAHPARGPRPAMNDRPEHFVDTAPWDPHAVEALTPEQERYYLATQWQLMWWKLKRHKLAVASGIVLLLLYASVLVSEFLAPYNLHSRNIRHIHRAAPDGPPLP